MPRTDDGVPDYALDPHFHAYVDGKLSAEEFSVVEARLSADPSARSATVSWRHHRDLINDAAETLHTGQGDIRTAALERELAGRLMARRRQALVYSPLMRQIAASVAIFGFGWFSHQGYMGLILQDQPNHLSEAVAAHQNFAYDALRPVEFSPQEMETALAWLSEKMERKLNSPKLEALGLSVVGARLVSTSEGPAGLFIYQEANGERLSVLLAAHAPDAPTISLRMVHDGDQSVAYWIDEALDYAVLGRQSSALLTQVAAAVSWLK